MLVSDFKENLTAMLHGNTLNKVRSVESAMQRASHTLLTKIDPIDTERIAALSNTIHDDVYNYSLPSDYKKIIDLYPQTRRESLDTANRNLTERFDLRKKMVDKTVSIEGSEGSKIIRINWRTRQPKTINEANDTTSNGTWSVVATASSLVADSIDYVSGSGSLKVNLAATGDGIQNTTMSAIDLTDENQVADFFVWIKIKSSADLALFTSATLIFGNNLTTKFWTGVAQTTQADGSAFKVGWNQIKVPWSTATQTGTVAPATINSLKLTFAITGAITQIRVDNITCSIGRNFDIKYYSKFLIKNTAGTFITKTTNDDDTIVLDDDAIQIYLLESLIACAHQMEGADSGFDITWAQKELMGQDLTGRTGLYARYKAEYPSMAKKALSYYGSSTTRRHFRYASIQSR